MEVALDLVSVLSGVLHFNVQFLGKNFLFETFLCGKYISHYSKFM